MQASEQFKWEQDGEYYMLYSSRYSTPDEKFYLRCNLKHNKKMDFTTNKDQLTAKFTKVDLENGKFALFNATKN